MSTFTERAEEMRAWPHLEFAHGVPQETPVVTYRRGTNWLAAVPLGAEVHLVPAHRQDGPRRVLRLLSIERLSWKLVPKSVQDSLRDFYGEGPDGEEFLRITLG
ncbi:MAG: hypothetical protein IT349_19355 [Candidatus Eisenbacteria bacterium]|nr:hypothetical protein [Candidatus Eisenbacteria bacterium]